MMSNIKISQKFFILGLLAFISLLFLGFLAFNINKKGYKNLSDVFADFTNVQNIQTTYIEPLFALRETNLTLVMSPNENFKQKADKKLLERLGKLDISFQNAPYTIKQNWNNYKKLLLSTREYALNGFDEGAFMNAVSSEREQFYALVEELKLFQKQKLNDSQITFLEAGENTTASEYYIIIGFLVVGLSSFVFDLLVIKKIVNSIEKVQYGLSQFFVYLTSPNKTTNTDTIIHLDSRDELGIMADAINKQVNIIKQSLKKDYELIEEATSTLHDLKEGIFGKRLNSEASSKELNTLKNVMNEMIDNLENKIQEEIINRTKQEKLLAQQSKLASMGNMLGNIAHQWRQPISEVNAILMEVEASARFDKIEVNFLLKNIALCYEITEHMSNTISDFQSFFKPSKEKESFFVHEICNSAISIITSSLKFHNIKFEFNINEDKEIFGYPREFAHAILNILSNAKDVLVERNIKNPKIILTIKTGKKFTIIKIEDNAGGIQLDNIETVFEPYFTTKHAKQGTGIGLYMTKSIIENNMNGYVNVENNKNGACFTIKIR